MEIINYGVYIPKCGEFISNAIKNAKYKSCSFLYFNDILYKIIDDKLIQVAISPKLNF